MRNFRLETVAGRIIQYGYTSIESARLGAWQLGEQYGQRLLIFDKNNNLQV